MTQIRVRGERRIKPGCVAEFTAAAAEAMARHRELDGPGTLAFDTFIDAEHGVWLALEHYVDSAAMLHHLAVRDPAVSARITAISEIGRTELYGTPSADLAQLLAKMGDGVTVFADLDALRPVPR